MLVPISVVCPTHKGNKKLPKLINSILNNTVKPNEIIICGTNINDIKGLNQKGIKFIVSSISNQSYQRKLAIKKSKNQLLLQCDDDIILEKEFFKKMYDHFKEDIKERLREFKHKNYIPVSRYRNKFVTQNFIPNLTNDWKILIYLDKYYIFERPVRANDFRASGSGKEQYLFGDKANIPDGIFDYAKSIYDKLDAPMLSIDIAYANKQFYTLEFQFTGFGTAGQQLSENYFSLQNSNWKSIYEKLELEQVFVNSIIGFLNKK